MTSPGATELLMSYVYHCIFLFQVEESGEEVRKLKSDAQAAEKQVLALKSRMAKHNNGSGSTKQLSTTRSEKDSSTSSVTPHHTAQNNLGFINSFSAKDDVSVISEESKKRKFVAVAIAPSSSQPSKKLTYSLQKEKENKAKVNVQDILKSNKPLNSVPPPRKAASRTICCVCQKAGGMILKCQCDSITCQHRAHAICLKKFRETNKLDPSSKTLLCQGVAA